MASAFCFQCLLRIILHAVFAFAATTTHTVAFTRATVFAFAARFSSAIAFACTAIFTLASSFAAATAFT